MPDGKPVSPQISEPGIESITNLLDLLLELKNGTVHRKIDFTGRTLRAKGNLFFEDKVFKNDVIFRSLALNTSLTFFHCIFEGPVNFKDAHIDGSLSFENCTFIDNEADVLRDHKQQVDLRGIQLNGSLILRGVKSQRKVSLSGAKIDGSIKAGARKRGDNGELEIQSKLGKEARSQFADFIFSDSKIEGSVDFGGCKIDRNLIAERTEIGGSLVFTWRNRELTRPRKNGASVGSKDCSKFEDLRTEILGDLDLDNIKLGGDLIARGINVANKVSLIRSEIEGMVTFKAWHIFERSESGEAYLDKSLEKSEDTALRMTLGDWPEYIGMLPVQTSLGKLSLQHSKVQGQVILTGARIGSGGKMAVRLTNAEIGGLGMSCWKPLFFHHIEQSYSDDLTAQSAQKKLDPKVVDAIKTLVSRLPASSESDASLLDRIWGDSRTKIYGLIDAENAVINGQVTIQGAYIKGPLHFRRAKIGGDLVLKPWRVMYQGKPYSQHTELRQDDEVRGSEEPHRYKAALILNGAEITGSMYFAGLLSDRGIEMLSTSVGISMNGFIDPSTFNTSPGFQKTKLGKAIDIYGRNFSLRCASSKIGGNVIFNHLEAETIVSFEASEIKGDFNIFQSFIHDGVSAEVDREVEPSKPASLMLNNIHVGGMTRIDSCKFKEMIRGESATFQTGLSISNCTPFEELSNIPIVTKNNPEEISVKPNEDPEAKLLNEAHDDQEGNSDDRKNPFDNREHFVNMPLATVNGDCDFKGNKTNRSVNMNGSTINGLLEITGHVVTADALARNSKPEHMICDLRFHNCEITSVAIKNVKVRGISFDYSKIRQNFVLKGDNYVQVGVRRNTQTYRISMSGCHLGGSLDISGLNFFSENQKENKSA